MNTLTGRDRGIRKAYYYSGPEDLIKKAVHQGGLLF